MDRGREHCSTNDRVISRARSGRRLANEIADHLRVKLTGEQRARPPLTANAHAYEAYLRGMFEWNQRTDESTRRALEYFRQASALDPDFALAHVGVANSYVIRSNYGFSTGLELRGQAKSAVLKALEIDSNLAEAHNSLAALVSESFDWTTADQEYRRAIELNPNYATAHHWYAIMLLVIDRIPEAAREMRRARELDPLSPVLANEERVAIPLFQGNFDEAIRNGEQIFASHPQFVYEHLLQAYILKGAQDRALAIKASFYEDQGDREMYQLIRRAYIEGGFEKAVKAEIRTLIRRSQKSHVPALDIARRHAELRDLDGTVTWLHNAYERHEGIESWMNDPIFHFAKSDSRFNGLAKRMNLPWAH
jgi:tetratricopeptide (TPR) repeat protein